MATLTCCGGKRNAKAYRLPSSVPQFSFQHLYHLASCKVCELELMQWRGEEPDGTLGRWNDIDFTSYPAWRRRIETGEARPQLQRYSEYTTRIAGDPEQVAKYLARLKNSLKWWKGQRVPDAYDTALEILREQARYRAER